MGVSIVIVGSAADDPNETSSRVAARASRNEDVVFMAVQGNPARAPGKGFLSKLTPRRRGAERKSW
jgi:hypothetical protein